MVKVNYQFEKRKKELEKKRKKEQKLRLKQQKKNNQPGGTPIQSQAEDIIETPPQTPPLEATDEKPVEPPAKE